jgi:hypothetical protein
MLPAGLSLGGTTGLISGTPTIPGTTSVTITATNVIGSGSALLQITIQDGPLPPPSMSGLPQNLSLEVNANAVLPVNATLNVSYDPGPDYSNLQYIWTITPVENTNSALKSSSLPGTPLLNSSPGNSPVISKTGVPALGLATYTLAPGPYTISDYATNGILVSNIASQTVTLVVADLSSARVYPNPWRSDKGYPSQITMDRLPLGSTVKIFTISGHRIKTLTPNIDTVGWDLTNDAGDKVAAGIYIYVITDGQGDKVRGKLGIIK